MRFLLSKVPDADVKAFGSEDDFFESEKGEYFYLEVDMQEDQLVISDTCGRYMPVGYDDIEALGNVLVKIARFNRAMNDQTAFLNKLLRSHENIGD